MLVDGQEGLLEEEDPPALFVLRLLEDGLHLLHVAGRVAVDLLQHLLVAPAHLGAASQPQEVPASQQGVACGSYLAGLLLDQRRLLLDLLLLVR